MVAKSRLEVDKMKLQEIIGYGSSGVVYRATLMEENYAVKIVTFNEEEPKYQHDPDDSDDIEVVCRNEITSLQNCSFTPFLVQYYGSYVVNTSLWIVMEYCQYGALSSFLTGTIASMPGYEDGLLRLIVKDIIRGLEHLHRNGVIHCDLKCANILVSKEGFIKIGDLGIAMHLMDRNSCCEVKSKGQFKDRLKGSLYWIAPESIYESVYNSKVCIDYH